MSINNPFSPVIDAATVSGNFYDMKSQVEFSVNIVMTPNHDSFINSYIFDSLKINIDSANASSKIPSYASTTIYPDQFTSTLSGYKLPTMSISTNTKVTGANIYYPFLESVGEYKIQYTAYFRPENPESTTLIKTSYIQIFNYYAAPASLLDTFTVVGDVYSGSDITVQNVTLSNVNSSDTTLPAYVIFTFQDNDDEAGDTNNKSELDAAYTVKRTWSTTGEYTLTENTLDNGSSYYITATAVWALGYSSAQTSIQIVEVANLPKINKVKILPLYTRNESANVITITLSSLATGDIAPSNLWFQFYNSSNVLVAEAGGNNGIVYSNTSLEYSLTLNQLVKKNSLSLVNGVAYSLKVKAEYVNVLSSPIYRSSSIPVSVTFALTQPTISSISVKDLFLGDPAAVIATINVSNEAYQLYAPYADAGIEFVFYNDGTKVARTVAYDFKNTGTGTTVTGSNAYPIKLNEVNSVNSGKLENGIAYTVYAAVNVTNHAGTTQYLESTEYYSVTFTLTQPTISSISVKDLFLRDTDASIAIINVNNEAYQLYAPYATAGIQFVFYNGSTEAARTVAYNFENTAGTGTTVTGSNAYPIKLTDVNSGNLDHGINYTVYAAVKVTNSTVYLESTESYTVTFALTQPTISDISVKDLYISDAAAAIATISVNNEAYQLYAPYATAGIQFVFYNGITEVARTVPYNFVNTAGTGSTVTGSNAYPIKLNEVNSVNSGNLENGIAYTVYAAVKVTNSTVYLVSTESSSVTFALTKPTISSIVPYDLQNDGGDDGVHAPSTGDVDSADQIIAAITVPNAPYQLYAPNSVEGIQFVFYDSNNNILATTVGYTFLNAKSATPNVYSVRLNQLTLTTGTPLLTNGTPYKVKVEVTLIEPNEDEELRPSDAYTAVTFTQNLAPLSYVVALNTWEYVSDQTPESFIQNFTDSPIIGISGSFPKTAQFGSTYSKNLDTTYTKFKIEYKVNSTSWKTVKKAKLVLQGSGVTLQAAAALAVSTAGSLSTVSSGQFANIPGAGDIVFYLPQNQEGPSVNAFDETDTVDIRVSVVDTSSPSIWGGQTTSSSVADSMTVIKKIDAYTFTVGQPSEPWNHTVGSNLYITIPVVWNSAYSNSVNIKCKYSSTTSFDHVTAVSFLKINNPTSVSFQVYPAQGTTLYYQVVYVVQNLNIGPTSLTNGISVDKQVNNQYFPKDSDYAITNASFNTFNTNSQSSITFSIAFTSADSKDRIDGVNVYFTSPNDNTGSNINKIRIGSYTSTSGGSKTIALLLATGDNLRTLTSNGTITTSSSPWKNYTMANISFEAYRDARVTSADAPYNSSSTTSNPASSDYYVESGGNSNFGSPSVNPIWNVPILTAPSSDGSITLSGGIVNSTQNSDSNNIKWTVTSNPVTTTPFTYDVKLTKKVGEGEPTTVTDTINFSDSVGNFVLDITLGGVNAVAMYTVKLTKVFNGSTNRREKSPVDEMIFNTLFVDTSAMAVSVVKPSIGNTVNISWSNPVLTGDSFNAVGVYAPSFSNNINTQYIQYVTGTSTEYKRLGSGNIIEQINSPDIKKQYTLPDNPALGTLYTFTMYVKAQVVYSVNGVSSTTVNGKSSAITSTPVTAPLTPVTSVSKYKVVQRLSVDAVSTTNAARIVQTIIPTNTESPTLLININANGLENEGLISVIFILAQDGTPDKAEGENVILVFPDSGSTFSLDSVVNPISSDPSIAAADSRIIPGESLTTYPRNLSNTPISGHSKPYKLTIGTVNQSGRYGLSTLTMPPSVDSGFIAGTVVNYMVIITNRTGTEVEVGEFEYKNIPTVKNVQIVNSNGAYSVKFDLESV